MVYLIIVILGVRVDRRLSDAVLLFLYGATLQEALFTIPGKVYNSGQNVFRILEVGELKKLNVFFTNK